MCHDLYTTLGKQTTISLTELLEHIHTNSKELHEAVAHHKNKHVDGGVPIAPCPTNLLVPILQKQMPGKIRPQKKRSTDFTDSAADACPTHGATEASSTTPKRNAVGSTAAEEEREAPSDVPLSQTPGSTKRRRWKIDRLNPPQPPVVARGLAVAKAAAKFARKRIRSKTTVQRGASSSRAASSRKTRREGSAAKPQASSSSSKRPAH